MQNLIVSTRLVHQALAALALVAMLVAMVPTQAQAVDITTAKLTLTVEVANGGPAVAEDWTVYFFPTQGSFGLSSEGSIEHTFTEQQFSEITQLGGEIAAGPTDTLSSVTDNYVAGNWNCSGGIWFGARMFSPERGDDMTCTIVFTYVPSEEPELTEKDQCKEGEWMSFTNLVFKNQGQCVSYIATMR